MAAAGLGRGADRVDAQARGDVHQRGHARSVCTGKEDLRSGIIMTRMLALRYVYVLALVVWLGGMVVLGAVVAPATSRSCRRASRRPAARSPARVFGAILARFHYVAYAAGGAAAGVAGGDGRARPAAARPCRARRAHRAAMLAVALYSGVVVLRESTRSSARSAACRRGCRPRDARRVRFDALHLLSTRLMMLNMARRARLLLLLGKRAEQ